MRIGIWSAALVASLAMPISSSHAVEVWQGEAVITAASPGCTAALNDTRRNLGVGSVVKTVLRPKLVSDNGNDTRVSFTHESGATFAIILPGGAMPAASYAAFGASQSGLIVANRGGAYTGFVQNPTTIASSDVFVRLTGQIEDFIFIDGCDVTFRATYSKRPADD